MKDFLLKPNFHRLYQHLVDDDVAVFVAEFIFT